MESLNGHTGHCASDNSLDDTVARSMRIAMIMPPWYEVPPAGYGGVERGWASLSDGPIPRGHQVALFRTGSRTRTRAGVLSTHPHLPHPPPPEPMPGPGHV